MMKCKEVRRMIGNWIHQLADRKVVQRFVLGILGDTVLLMVGMVVAYYVRVAL